MEYFFLGKYDREKARQALLDLGYIEVEIDSFGDNKTFQYILSNNMIRVNLTSPEQGKIHIQGDGLEGIKMNGKCSKCYSDLERLAKYLKPERIVTGAVRDVFPELLRR